MEESVEGVPQGDLHPTGTRAVVGWYFRRWLLPGLENSAATAMRLCPREGVPVDLFRGSSSSQLTRLDGFKDGHNV